MIVTVVLNLLVLGGITFSAPNNLILKYTVQSQTPDHYQVFYGEDQKWNEQNSVQMLYEQMGQEQTLVYELPHTTKKIRMDFGENKGLTSLSHIEIQYRSNHDDITEQLLEHQIGTNDIGQIDKKKEYLVVDRVGSDSYIEIDLEQLVPQEWFKFNDYITLMMKVLAFAGLNGLLLLFVKKRRRITGLIKEIVGSRVLIWNLSKNDFKTKYAGSYLGIIWAFIQPVVTVLIYWFVFQVGFRSAPIDDFPFVLWLVAGLVPWFFFAEAITNATYSMVEYSYLVKKVVFKISILPIVKILSAFFVHVFFVGFTIVLYMIYGYMPTLYTLQVIYYTICVFMLVMGLAYATSAIMIFFKDLGQLIGILLQVGVWMTPIMWSYTMIPGKFQWLFKLNPMYYIVEGYRDALINHVWFWDKIGQTIYFWIFVMILLFIGSTVFKKLKVHFADVL